MVATRWIAVALLGPAVLAAIAPAAATYIREESWTKKWPAVELSSSAIFVSMFEITPTDWKGKANTLLCYDQVDKAKATNAKKIQFIPTVHWKGTDVKVNSYCYRNQYFTCQDVTPVLISQFKDGMQKCIQYAVDQGFTTISMLPHLDNDATYYWRNKAWFDPLENVKGVNYHDILVDPVARAMHDVALAAKAPIAMYLTLQGETGKSVIFGPRAWITSYQQAKGAMTKDLPADRAALMKVGVSMNHNQICACLNFGRINKTDYLNTYSREFLATMAAENYRFDFLGIRTLYAVVDFIGLSSYPAMNIFKAGTSDLEAPQKMNVLELGFFGVHVQQMIAQGKEVIISETGIGGGDQWGGVEKNVENVAKNPFWGLWAQYATRADPWANADSAAYRKELYREYIRWLGMGTGPMVKISHVFTWSGGSWDVLGTHYSSTAEEGTFRDDDVYKWVSEHNAKVNGVVVKSSAEVNPGV